MWFVVTVMESLSLDFAGEGSAGSAGVMSRYTAGVVLRFCEEATSVERVAEAGVCDGGCGDGDRTSSLGSSLTWMRSSCG